ncbi:NAD(P)-binding domain-containing protein [Marinobacter sp. F4216]|uniref:NAD(P)-binding domain-containing protein n=1 Tax=Marinobacter sp. F4216 TaxID=2874281 RepID=UPI001CBB97AA|nr:NAD(P)-binding domain-containing protein [Marinobacter sp. F4216]MBZ2168831.1 NAD(P)-binding domain-containing protein [Marinobacter sp. F4216]
MSGVNRVDCVIVGAGHAGLAFSACLQEQQIDHVLLERGEVANAWLSQRWDSLRLLTPNWQSQLPGYAYRGDSPDAFMTAQETARFISGYAGAINAPVQTSTAVRRATIHGEGFKVETSRGDWQCRSLVVASGAFARPKLPVFSSQLSPAISQFSCLHYRNPRQLPYGDVMVVGASASGLQIAAELAQSGRGVVLCAGEHVRMPRTYRGLDIQRWLHLMGMHNERYDQVEDLKRLRRLSSPQLIGDVAQRIFDLNHVRSLGVQLAGRLVSAHGQTVQFSGSLRNHCALADLKLQRLVRRIDDWADRQDLLMDIDDPVPFGPTQIESSPLLKLNLAQRNIRSVIWANGLQPDYRWLDMPAFDDKGRLKHDGGIADIEGLYVMGLPFMRRRNSSFIHGAGEDARELSSHLVQYLESVACPMDNLMVGNC